MGSSDAGKRYKMYGRANNCAEGKGGEWANDVYYVLNPIGKCYTLSDKNLGAKLPKIKLAPKILSAEENFPPKFLIVEVYKKHQIIFGGQNSRKGNK